MSKIFEPDIRSTVIKVMEEVIEDVIEARTIKKRSPDLNMIAKDIYSIRSMFKQIAYKLISESNPELAEDMNALHSMSCIGREPSMEEIGEHIKTCFAILKEEEKS